MVGSQGRRRYGYTVTGTPGPHHQTGTGAGVLALFVFALSVGMGSAVTNVNAEVHTTVSIDAYNSLTFSEDESTASALAQGEIDFESVGGGDVRSRLQLRATLSEMSVGTADTSATHITIPRAEIRWRMLLGDSYRVRFTAGRSRLTWGDGVLYNAADTINGARPGTTNLTADVLRDETQWLIAGYLPLGRFAFLEPVVLMPAYASAPDTSQPPAPAPAWQTAAGSRLQFKMGQIKTEIGYLYRGDEEIHQPSLAVQGNIGVDWYLGLSLRLPERPSEELFTSGGLLYQGNNRRIGGWSARIESLWEQRGERLSIYPELTWSPSQLFSLFLRSDMAIVEGARLQEVQDLASQSSFGVGWTPMTGLTISFFSTVTTPASADPSSADPSSADTSTGNVTLLVSYTF